MWIDVGVELVPGERLVAVKNVTLAEEHLHDHFASGDGGGALPVMPGCLVVEGMAQSAGILVGHAGGFREKVILAKVSRARLELDAAPGQTLRHTAEVRSLDEAGASAAGVVEVFDHARPDAGWSRLGEIDLLFSHIDRNRGGVRFPEHNFVFGEQFKTLLRTSGVAIPEG